MAAWPRAFATTVPIGLAALALLGVSSLALGARSASAAAVYAVSTAPDAAGRIIAPVMIDGHGPYRFLLDTGATRTVLARSVLAALDLKPTPGRYVSVTGISGMTLAPTVHVARLEVGSLQLHDLSVPVLTGPVLGDVDGILSLQPFFDKNIAADFVGNRLTISSSAPRGWPVGVVPVRLQFTSRQRPMVRARVGDIPVEAIIDTGATSSLGNAALLTALQKERALQMLQRYVYLDGIVDATRTSRRGILALVPAVSLGSSSIHGLHVTFGDFEIFNTWGLQRVPALLLGTDALRGFAELDIDYPHRELQLLPRQHARGYRESEP